MYLDIFRENFTHFDEVAFQWKSKKISFWRQQSRADDDPCPAINLENKRCGKYGGPRK